MKKKIMTILLFVALVFGSICCVRNETLSEGTSDSFSGAVEAAADSSFGTAEAAEASEIVAGEAVTISAKVSDSDKNTGWDETAAKITLNGSSATVSGSGAAVSGSVVTITQKGDYVISGTLTDGQIVIAATSSDKVHLILNGVDITNKMGAPIYASQCDKLIITLAEGTQNILTDGGSDFQYADADNKEPNAALFSKDDLTINGTGGLTVNAGFNNGIGTKDDLLVLGGNITVNALNHGIRGNDSVTVLDGVINITSGSDGIQTNNTEDASKGWILIEGGVLDITSGNDGIQADTVFAAMGGEFKITAGVQEDSQGTDSDSSKGIKSDGDISIGGGSFAIESTDDAIHANGSITINGGEFTLSTGDDGVHADGDLTVNAGNIKVNKSYEGLEAANINITGGTIDIVSSDDALNAAGGAGQSGNTGRPGGGGFASSGAYSINISGGSVTMTAGGDGIDSNGTVNISGGTVVSLINSTPDNEAIDSDGGVTFTGGTIIYGGTGTGGSLGAGSTQSYVFISSGVSAGTEITVKKDGNTLITFTPAIECRYLALSSPDILSGEGYEVYGGSTLISTVTAGTGSAGMGGRGGMGGGRGGRGMEGGDLNAPGGMPGGDMQPPDGWR